MRLTFEEKYQAIVNKDSSYEGLFITAVKTTGIFCRPVCSARKPKVENVEFFNSISEALQNGYRPCKVCRPLENAGEIPGELKKLLSFMEDHPNVKLKDSDLLYKGLEPSSIRRWFKKNYGMTFHDYQRKLRLNYAYDHLTSGKSVSQTAYASGFDSLSGFSDSMQRVFSVKPSQVTHKNILNIIRIITPLGPMIGCATDQGVCMLEFADRKDINEYLEKLSSQLSAAVLPGHNQHLDALRHQVKDYFQGQRKNFDLTLFTVGTSFQKAVWKGLQEIPYGETRYYSQQAAQIGRPDSVRAVAAANGQNRIALVIPCHRVVGKNGNLTGYAGGIHRKKWLLDMEQGILSLGLDQPG